MYAIIMNMLMSRGVKMDKRIVSILRVSIVVAVIVFALHNFFSRINSIYGFISALGETITITMVFLGMYVGFIWRIDPLDKTPVILGKYKGLIEYDYEGVQSKEIDVTIKQTLLSVKVMIKTDEIVSTTKVSSLIEENGEYVLYYIYITDPKMKYSDKNPIRHGTCRLLVADDRLIGKYWTSGKTSGDIEMTKIVSSK